MNIRLNQNIQFLSPERLQSAPLKQEVVEKLNQAHKGSEIVLETKDGFVKSVDLAKYLEKPEQYAGATRSFFSIDVGGKSVVVELANLTKENILAALDKALGKLESGPLQGVASSEFLQSVSGLVSQIRGKEAPGSQPAIEQQQSRAYMVEPGQANTRPPVQANDQQAGKVLEQAMDQIDKGSPGLDPVARKARIIETVLSKLGGQAWASLPQPQQQALQKLLDGFSLKELRAVEIQGFGGAKSGEGVTGSGSEGHYTNSVLSSVQQLFTSGRMNQAVVEGLTHMQQAPLANDLQPQRQGLLRSALQDIAFPETINQHAKGTCAAAVIQMQTALQDPGHYLAILSELASPDGKVSAQTLGSKDDQMLRVKGTSLDDKSGRSVSGRLIQPAFMEYADGKKQHYDNETDKHSKPGDTGGLSYFESAHLLEGLFGKKTYQAFGKEMPGGVPKLMQLLESNLSAGLPVSVGLRWQDESHRILVTGLDRKANAVYFINPQGGTERMPLDEFTQQVNNLACKAGVKPGGDSMQALRDLGGHLGDAAKYQPLEGARYRTMEMHFAHDPNLQTLPEGQRNRLFTVFKKLELHILVPHLSNLAKGGKYIEDLLKTLETTKADYTARKEVGLFSFLQKAEDEGRLPGTKVREILDSPVRENLNLDDFRALLDAVKASPADQPKIDSLIQRSKDNVKAAAQIEVSLKALGVKPATIQKLLALLKSSIHSDRLQASLQNLGDKKLAERVLVFYTAVRSVNNARNSVLNQAGRLQPLLELQPELKASAKDFKALLKAMSLDDSKAVDALISTFKSQ